MAVDNTTDLYDNMRKKLNQCVFLFAVLVVILKYLVSFWQYTQAEY